MKLRRFISLVFVLCAFTAFAHAQQVTPEDIGTRITLAGQMHLDCVNMTASAREYANKHNLCSSDSIKGVVTPNGSSTGTCGTTYIYIQRLGSGYVTFNIGANSTQGPMSSVFWTVPFTNQRTNQSGSLAGSQLGISTSYNIYTSTTYTNTGVLQAGLYGNVGLFWGGNCIFNGAVDFALVN